MENSIRHVVWGKLYRSTLFDGIRFPEGFNYEDGRTTYRLFQKAETVTLIPDVLYHYIKQKGSITYTETIQNLLDIWSCYTMNCTMCSARKEKNTRMPGCFFVSSPSTSSGEAFGKHLPPNGSESGTGLRKSFPLQGCTEKKPHG